MPRKSYEIINIKEEPSSLHNPSFWMDIPKASIENYLWMKNGYTPTVEAKVCYSPQNLFVGFKSYEKEILARYTEHNKFVHKDSCVEFFINLFPLKSKSYFNFEINPIGTIHIGFGELGNRSLLSDEEINSIEIFSLIKEPCNGKYGNEFWEVYYKIPLSLFENRYDSKFIAQRAIGNFFKCGDDAKFPHFGVWNNVESSIPNFHLPEYFGNLIFLKSNPS